ncbi:putative HVA22-like protein g isoform X1 [Malus domestica]|uniref:putative HVA22-like protein g isoform X1 n=1 Tax=Malus domestica TaxID=3750 RepID=UPI0039752536
MLGSLLTRILILSLGYAYPAFECYKTVEKNRVEIEELRFWCQYWIIVAMLTVLERVGDVFISWLPMYGEGKVALFIYLWYPKTQGTGFVYKTFLRPYVAKHETDIDRKLLEMRARAWDLTVFYWQNCAQYGHTAFLQALQYLAANSTNFAAKTTTEVGHIYNAIHFSGFSSIDRSIVCIRILDRPSNRSFTWFMHAIRRHSMMISRMPQRQHRSGQTCRFANRAERTSGRQNPHQQHPMAEPPQSTGAMSEPPRSPKVVQSRHQTDGGRVDELTEKLRLRPSKPIQ